MNRGQRGRKTIRKADGVRREELSMREGWRKSEKGIARPNEKKAGDMIGAPGEVRGRDRGEMLVLEVGTPPPLDAREAEPNKDSEKG